MTDKAYIVANEQQEHEVLEKLEREGCEWLRSSKNPTDFIPSHDEHTIQLPYCLILDYDQISWCDIELLYNFEIVYDGRKEEKMSEKYVVSQEFIEELRGWKAGLNINGQYYVSDEDIFDTPVVIEDWWKDDTHALEQNNRLIAIIRWVNGEGVFEVEKPKKWVVRSKETDDDNDHWYVRLPNNIDGINDVVYYMSSATLFNTKEEAQSWANSHQEVVEVN